MRNHFTCGAVSAGFQDFIAAHAKDRTLVDDFAAQNLGAAG
jgi:hypothetical protein